MKAMNTVHEVGEEGAASPSLEKLLGNFSGESFPAVADEFADNLIASSVESHLQFGFKVGEFNFLISKGCRCEVIVDASCFSLPNSPSMFIGLTNVRGNFIPVYRMDEMLELNDKVTEHKYILIFGKAEDAVGVTVSAVPRSHDLTNARRLNSLPAMPNSLLAAVSGGYFLKDSCWLEFDYELYFDYFFKQ